MPAINPPRKIAYRRADGLVRPSMTSHYQCQFDSPPPRCANFIDRSFTRDNLQPYRDLTIPCRDATLPGSSLSTLELNDDFTGVTQKHAHRRLYDDRADFTFYVDHKYRQIRYFEAWIRFICGEQISDANLTMYGGNSVPYRVEYPDQYKTTFHIVKFERDYIVGEYRDTMLNTSPRSRSRGSGYISYTFFNAFPISINSMPLSYDSSQLLQCTVSLSYDRYIASSFNNP